MSSALLSIAEKSIQDRVKNNWAVGDASTHFPSNTADFFCNDYLSLASLSQLRQGFLKELENSTEIFGSEGSRVGGGTKTYHIALEQYFRDKFEASGAMIFNSGYLANLSFLSCVPQKGDVIMYDELIHASIHDGMQASRVRNALIPFEHNSLSSLEDRLNWVLLQYPHIAAGEATVFVAVETTYSMDGDFCPLRELIELVEKYIPPAAAHIIVDEAHSLGLFGPQGTGLVKAWNLENRVHTVIYPLTKAVNFIGAVVLTSPTLCRYMASFCRPLVFTTSMPHLDVIAIKHSFDIIMSPIGEERRRLLNQRTAYFLEKMQHILKTIPSDLLALPKSKTEASTPDLRGLLSPIFPVLTNRPLDLQRHLNERGYAARGISFPVVPKKQERIRVVLHSNNTIQEIDDFVETLQNWAMAQMDYTSQVSAKL